MAEFMEMRPVVSEMYIDEEKKLMVTADSDNKIGVRWLAILMTCINCFPLHRYGTLSHCYPAHELG